MNKYQSFLKIKNTVEGAYYQIEDYVIGIAKFVTCPCAVKNTLIMSIDYAMSCDDDAIKDWENHLWELMYCWLDERFKWNKNIDYNCSIRFNKMVNAKDRRKLYFDMIIDVDDRAV